MSKLSRGPVRVIWDNPPAGLTLEFSDGTEMHVSKDGALTIAEAGLALDLSGRRVYQLIDEGEIRVRGSGVRRVPVSEVRRLKFPGGQRGRSFVN